MRVSVEKPGSPEELIHFGKKGMKWGVRKSYLDSVSKRGAQQRRVAEGKGSLGDKLKVGLTTSGLTIGRAKKRGVSPAMERAIRTEEHIARIKAGKATTHDILRAIGSTTMPDLKRGVELAF